MRKNRWLLFGLLLACVVGVALGVLALLPRPGVTRENFDRIEVGMSRADVEAIFGGPANGVSWWADLDRDVVADADKAGWEDADGFNSATIVFDEHDRVVSMRWIAVPDARTTFEKLLDHLPWRERQRRDAISVVRKPDIIARCQMFPTTPITTERSSGFMELMP